MLKNSNNDTIKIKNVLKMTKRHVVKFLVHTVLSSLYYFIERIKYNILQTCYERW